MKNIAFDIDGVLTDIEKFQLEVGGQFFKEKYGLPIVNRNGYSIKEIFNCTSEQEYEFWKKNIIFYASKYPIRPGASETINKLINDGFNVFIISSRIKTSEDSALGLLMRTLLKRWLVSNGINISPNNMKFCSVENSGIEKANMCEQNNIDYIVEDCPSNIKELKTVTNVICYLSNYNRDCFDDIDYVTSFHEIYDIISKNYSIKKFRFLKKNERNQLDKQQLIEYYKQLKESYLNSETAISKEKTEKFYHICYPLLKKIFDLKYPYTLENENSIPDKDGVIFVANHRDMIDPPLIMSCIGNRPTHLLLKSEFLDTKFSSFLKVLGCVFVVRGNRDSEILSSEELSKLVLKGSNIIIFPEGTRNKTKNILLDFKTGAVSIAQRTGAPIVPLSITKVFDDFSEKIVIKAGKEIYVDYFDDICDKNNELKQSIESMILESKDEKIKTK